MKIRGKVLSTKIDEKGRMLAEVQCDKKLPPDGTSITLSFGKKRSNDANAYYWKYLEFLMEAGMGEEYLTSESLHEVLKGRFLCKKKTDKHGMIYIVVSSTTELDTYAFTEYLDKIDKAMNEYQGIDSSPFQQDYQDFYSKH